MYPSSQLSSQTQQPAEVSRPTMVTDYDIAFNEIAENNSGFAEQARANVEFDGIVGRNFPEQAQLNQRADVEKYVAGLTDESFRMASMSPEVVRELADRLELTDGAAHTGHLEAMLRERGAQQNYVNEAIFDDKYIETFAKWLDSASPEDVSRALLPFGNNVVSTRGIAIDTQTVGEEQ